MVNVYEYALTEIARGCPNEVEIAARALALHDRPSDFLREVVGQSDVDPRDRVPTCSSLWCRMFSATLAPSDVPPVILDWIHARAAKLLRELGAV